MNWVHINDRLPEEDRPLFYFFEVLGVYRGKYEKYEYPTEFTGTEEPVYGNTFYCEKGFLTDDVTHWRYVEGWEDEEFLPEIPDEYVKVHGKHFGGGYTHKDNTLVVRKDEFIGLCDRLDYLLDGHLEGLVCQDGCPIHIYWKEEEDGYKCGGCGTVYPTDDVEANPEKYKESTWRVK